MANRATGKVIRLYVRRDETYIRLDIDPKEGPENGYFKLQLDNKNYNALYSLALTAAINRWPLTIRVQGEGPIAGQKGVLVDYLVVDWESGQGSDD